MRWKTIRWLAIVAASLVVLSGFCGDRPAAAQGNLPELSRALLQFESAVTWESVSQDWRGMRNGWIAAVQDARTPGELGAQLIRLETAMGWHSVEGWWRSRRPSWLHEMQSARAPSTISRGLLELETATLWSAVGAAWRGQRDPWIARIKSAAR